VRPLTEAGPGTARTFAVPGLRDGLAWAPRQWTAVTDDTGVGNPRNASAARGAEYFSAVAERIGVFLADLAAADPDALYA